MNAAIRERVRRRARNRCEYCQLRQEDSPLAALHVEHIVPRSHDGTDDLDNLALACIDCNLHKGTNLAGIDPQSRLVSRLFHPRRQRWDEHFKWQGIYIVGKTTIGRTTIRVLKMNSDEQLALWSS
jgi:5-methylcytosine-specific restriction endonuclease McrA